MKYCIVYHYYIFDIKVDFEAMYIWHFFMTGIWYLVNVNERLMGHIYHELLIEYWFRFFESGYTLGW